MKSTCKGQAIITKGNHGYYVDKDVTKARQLISFDQLISVLVKNFGCIECENKSTCCFCYSLQKGFNIINQLDDTKFEQFLRRIVTKMKLQDSEIFTAEEQSKLGKIFNLNEEQLLLAIKTVLYLFRRLQKFIFMPMNLKIDLKKIGLGSEKIELFVRVWSAETNLTLSELESYKATKHGDLQNFSWKVNAELSSVHCKKSKIPKTYLSLCSESEEMEIELTHPELYSVFLQMESIQNELDNILT